MKKKTLIVMLIALCLVLCSCGFHTGTDSAWGNNTGEGHVTDRGKKVEIGTYSAWGYNAGEGHVTDRVKKVEINWVDGSVQVAYHGSSEITFSETSQRKVGEDGELRWKVDGDTLRIEYAAPGFCSWFSPEKDLTLMLPESMTLDALKINVVSAQVWGNDLKVGGEAQVQSVSGDVQLGFAHAPRKVDADTVSGDVELRFAQTPEAITADAVSGDMTFYLPRNAGFTAEVDSISGRVQGDLPMEKLDKENYTCGDGACSISLDSVSGDVWFNAN